MRWVDGQILGLDLETTSADPFAALPVSYSLALRRNERLISYISDYVDPGVPIPPDATEIHGITDEMVQRDGVEMASAMTVIIEKLRWAEAEGIPLTGMNLPYDLTIIHLLGNLDGWQGNVLDVFVLDKAAHRYRRGSRKLTALAEFYGAELSEIGRPHSATADAVLSILVLEKMAEKYEWMRQMSPGRLHQLQVRWREQQQQNLSEYFEERGEPKVKPEEFGFPIMVGALEPKGAQ